MNCFPHNNLSHALSLTLSAPQVFIALHSSYQSPVSQVLHFLFCVGPDNQLLYLLFSYLLLLSMEKQTNKQKSNLYQPAIQWFSVTSDYQKALNYTYILTGEIFQQNALGTVHRLIRDKIRSFVFQIFS